MTDTTTETASPAEVTEARWRVVKRMMIVGGVLTAFFLVDGLVLLLTDGLNSDAGPLFPWLGGVFSENRSSGAGLLIIGVLALIVLAVGWVAYGRKVRDAHLRSAGVPDEVGMPGARPAPRG
jgi:hypothetical protein